MLKCLSGNPELYSIFSETSEHQPLSRRHPYKLVKISKNADILYNIISQTLEYQLSNGVSHLILWQFWNFVFCPPNQEMGKSLRENPQSIKSQKLGNTTTTITIGGVVIKPWGLYQVQNLGNWIFHTKKWANVRNDLKYLLVADKNTTCHPHCPHFRWKWFQWISLQGGGLL